LADLRLTERFVLLYAGNIGWPQELETLLAAAGRLGDDPRFHFLVVGDGARRAWFETEVRARGLRNVTLLGPRPRSDQQVFLNACDVGLVTLVRGMWGVSVPSRLYNFLAAGKPVLGLVEPGSEVDQVIREEGIGWSSPPGDVDRLVAAVREAASDGPRLAEMGVRARRAAERSYTGAPSLAYYRRLVTTLLAEAG
ncbi:MAG: glycosyltransferase family 4 protein, partial [Vicinamibacterales bacterium]